MTSLMIAVWDGNGDQSVWTVSSDLVKGNEWDRVGGLQGWKWSELRTGGFGLRILWDVVSLPGADRRKQHLCAKTVKG